MDLVNTIYGFYKFLQLHILSHFQKKNISISHKRSVLLSISGSVVAMLEAVMSFVPVEKIAVQKSLANILTSLQVSKDIFSVLST
jgi:hypothetical protein